VAVSDYAEAKARLVGVVESRGYAAGPARERRDPPRVRDRVHYCPVGFCDLRSSALPIEVPERGRLCVRHWPKLSGPMMRSLTLARRRGQRELEKVLREAVTEARAHDTHWHRWAVVERGRIEGFDLWRSAVCRLFTLLDEGLAPALVSGTNGRLITTAEARAYTPHTVVACDGEVLASSGDEPERRKASTSSPLAWALGLAGSRHSDGRAPVWPGGEPPSVVNDWTGEELPYAEACRLAARGHRG
jgi:hypothetical protein